MNKNLLPKANASRLICFFRAVRKKVVCVAEVKEHATRWIWTYSHELPNMALGGISPKQKLTFEA